MVFTWVHELNLSALLDALIHIYSALFANQWNPEKAANPAWMASRPHFARVIALPYVHISWGWCSDPKFILSICREYNKIKFKLILQLKSAALLPKWHFFLCLQACSWTWSIDRVNCTGKSAPPQRLMLTVSPHAGDAIEIVDVMYAMCVMMML